MSILKERWERISHKRKIKAMQSGYRWAMGGLMSGKLSLKEIETYVEKSRDFDDYDEFDEGVELACSEWGRKEQRIHELEAALSELFAWAKDIAGDCDDPVQSQQEDEMMDRINRVLEQP